MKSKNHILPLCAAALLGLMLAGSTNAATTLVDEDFQSPLLSNNTASPGFTGWTYVNGGSVKSRREDNQSDFPGDTAVTVPNQGIQLEWTNAEANYDTSHNWTSADVYTLKVNASPQSWNGTEARYIRPKIRQVSDNTVLWDPGETAATLIPIYDNNGNETWQDNPELEFTFTIDASTFTTGTEGEAIRLNLAHSGFRGMYYDNISLEVIPEPSGAALLGLGGLLLLRRRRR